MIWSVWISGRRVTREPQGYVWHTRFSGDRSDGDTPGPISNPAVKPVSADGTWGAAPWESRSLPENLVLFLALVTARRIAGLFVVSLTGHKPGFFRTIPSQTPLA